MLTSKQTPAAAQEKACTQLNGEACTLPARRSSPSAKPRSCIANRTLGLALPRLGLLGGIAPPPPPPGIFFFHCREIGKGRVTVESCSGLELAPDAQGRSHWKRPSKSVHIYKQREQCGAFSKSGGLGDCPAFCLPLQAGSFPPQGTNR